MTNTATKLHKPVVVANMNNDELMRAIRTRMTLTIEAIEELATLIREARRRNLSLAEFSTGMPRRLLMVAEQQLAAELVFKFCDEPTKIDALVGVSLDVQKALAAGESVAVVEEDGTKTDGLVTRTKTLRQMTAPQVRQVFAEGKQRSVAEQKQYRRAIIAASRKHVAKPSRSAEKGPRVTADTATGELVIGAYRLKLAAFDSALRLLGYRLTRVDK